MLNSLARAGESKRGALVGGASWSCELKALELNSLARAGELELGALEDAGACRHCNGNHLYFSSNTVSPVSSL